MDLPAWLSELYQIGDRAAVEAWVAKWVSTRVCSQSFPTEALVREREGGQAIFEAQVAAVLTKDLATDCGTFEWVPAPDDQSSCVGTLNVINLNGQKTGT